MSEHSKEFNRRKTVMLKAATAKKDEFNDDTYVVDFSGAYGVSIGVNAKSEKDALKKAAEWFDDPAVESVVMQAQSSKKS